MFMGLVLTTLKVIDLVKRWGRSSNKENLDEKLAYERELSKIKENRLRRSLEIRQEFANGQDAASFGAEYEIHSPSEYFNETKYDLNPIIGYIIPENFDALLYGRKNTMKSYLAMGTLIQIALGEKPRILSPRERDEIELPENLYCIYVDGENGGTVFKQRYNSLGTRLDEKMEIIESQFFGNNQVEVFSKIQERCLRHPSGTKILVCVDNIKSLMNDLSQNAGRSYLNELKKLRNTLEERGISLTTLTICHTEKTGEKIYGSYGTQCLSPIVIRIDEGEDYNHFVLTLENSRTDLKGQTRSLVVKNESYKFLEYEDSEASKEDRDLEEERLEEARAIRTWLDEDSRRTQEDAAKHFGYKTRGTIINRLKLLK